MPAIHRTIGDLIAENAQKFSNRDALVHTEIGIQHDFKNLSRCIDQAARGFLSRGIKPGDRVALWSSNVPEWIFSMLGLAKIGAVTVPIDPAATKDNLHYVLEQSESRALIFSAHGDDSRDETATAVKNELPALEHIFVIADSSDANMTTWNELMAGGEEVAGDTLLKVSAAVNP